MKRWQIVIVSAVLLIGLLVRGVYIQIRKEKEEKLGFVQRLHYEFYTKIDTISLQDKGRRMLYFHRVSKPLSPAVENKINQDVDRDQRQVFLHFVDNGLIKLRIRSDSTSRAGDSLYVNTDKDLIIEFRNGKEVLRCSALASLMRKR